MPEKNLILWQRISRWSLNVPWGWHSPSFHRFYFLGGRILEVSVHRITGLWRTSTLEIMTHFAPIIFRYLYLKTYSVEIAFKLNTTATVFLLWLSEGSGASAICPCFTNHHLAGIWQHVKSSQDSCFSTICWITKEITRLLGCLPDGKQVCLWV